MLLQASPSKSQIQDLQYHTALGWFIAAVGEGLPGATAVVEACPGSVDLALCLFYRWETQMSRGWLACSVLWPLAVPSPSAQRQCYLCLLLQLHIPSWGRWSVESWSCLWARLRGGVPAVCSSVCYWPSCYFPILNFFQGIKLTVQRE